MNETVECTCNRCGWVHFAMTREHAQADVDRFNVYFDGLEPEMQQEYYGGKRSTIASYERCFFCGQTDGDFRASKDSDCPMGCTIQPTIWEPAPETQDQTRREP